MKIQADWYGLVANLPRIRFGLSKPTNSAIARGRYFSASGMGNGRVALIGNRSLPLGSYPECNPLLFVRDSQRK